MRPSPAATAQCRVKYTSIYPKLQKKAVGTGSPCEGPRFTAGTGVNFGTVTDHLTGLQWEQKDASLTAHGKDVTTILPIAHVNAAMFDGVSAPCFTLHCDWRLPTRAELQTILSQPYPCVTGPCIDPVFGPTASAFYWSSTTFVDNPNLAWGVSFADGSVFGGAPGSANAFRAVRGGF